MKKILLIILLTIIPVVSHAQAIDWTQPVQVALSPAIQGMVSAGGAAAPSCTTSNDSKLVDKGGTSEGTLDGIYLAQKITIGATTTITEYTFSFCHNVDEKNITASLWSDDGGSPSKPSSMVADTESAAVVSTGTAACHTPSEATFTLATPKQVTAATYWIVTRLYSPAGSDDTEGAYDSSAGDRICYGTTGSSWSCLDNYRFISSLYGCQP